MTNHTPSTPQPIKSACNAMLDVRLPSHDEAIDLLFGCRAVIGRTGAISPSVQKSLMDQLSEMVSWIVEDQCNQTAEQAWRENEARAAPFALRPADFELAASIAAIREQPMEAL